MVKVLTWTVDGDWFWARMKVESNNNLLEARWNRCTEELVAQPGLSYHDRADLRRGFVELSFGYKEGKLQVGKEAHFTWG